MRQAAGLGHCREEWWSVRCGRSRAQLKGPSGITPAPGLRWSVALEISPMHYVPESSRAMMEGESLGADSGGLDRPSFHSASAPLYVLTAVVGLLLLADMLTGPAAETGWSAYHTLFGFRLALLAAVLGGARILYHTLEGLFAGKVGADLALTIACLAAILLGEHTVAALVVFIALCGESIEGYTVDRAASAISGIFQFCPRQAHVIRDGREVDVPVES